MLCLIPLGRKLCWSLRDNPIPNSSLDGWFYYKSIGKFVLECDALNM